MSGRKRRDGQMTYFCSRGHEIPEHSINERPLLPCGCPVQLGPDSASLIEVRDALQRCIDMLESDMHRGTLWQHTYDVAFSTAVDKVAKVFYPGLRRSLSESRGAIPVGQSGAHLPRSGSTK